MWQLEQPSHNCSIQAFGSITAGDGQRWGPPVAACAPICHLVAVHPGGRRAAPRGCSTAPPLRAARLVNWRRPIPPDAPRPRAPRPLRTRAPVAVLQPLPVLPRTPRPSPTPHATPSPTSPAPRAPLSRARAPVAVLQPLPVRAHVAGADEQAGRGGVGVHAGELHAAEEPAGRAVEVQVAVALAAAAVALGAVELGGGLAGGVQGSVAAAACFGYAVVWLPCALLARANVVRGGRQTRDLIPG